MGPRGMEERGSEPWDKGRGTARDTPDRATAGPWESHREVPAGTSGFMWAQGEASGSLQGRLPSSGHCCPPPLPCILSFPLLEEPAPATVSSLRCLQVFLLCWPLPTSP